MENIKDVRFESITDSKYIKPFRMIYKQDGREKAWDCVKKHDSVAILIFNKSRNVFVCVEQFRPSVYISRVRQEKNIDASPGSEWDYNCGSLGLTLELCAGIMDKNKTQEETAVEEVFEECGYKISSENLELIQRYLGDVGTAGTEQTIFFAEVTDSMRQNSGGGLVSEGEMIKVREMTIDEAKSYMAEPQVRSPTGFLLALYWFFATKVGVYLEAK